MKIRVLKENKGLWHGIVYDKWHVLGREYFFVLDTENIKWRKLCKRLLQDADKTTIYQVKVTCPDCLVKIDELIEKGLITLDNGELIAVPQKINKQSPVQEP